MSSGNGNLQNIKAFYVEMAVSETINVHAIMDTVSIIKQSF